MQTHTMASLHMYTRPLSQPCHASFSVLHVQDIVLRLNQFSREQSENHPFVLNVHFIKYYEIYYMLALRPLLYHAMSLFSPS